MGRRIVIFAAFALIAAPVFAVTTKDTASGVTADQIAALLTGPGVTITNAKITGAPNAIGTFTGANEDGLSVDNGVILSSGDIKTAAGPNTSEGTSGSLGQPGDAGLDALVAPYKTHDAVILEFDAVTVSDTFSIRYIFASEAYKEYVGSQYNDVFAFFVDGQNIATVPGTTQPVAVNTINQKTNSALYNDNPAFSGNFGTSFDGFTTELTAVASVSSGTTHHIRIALADTSDSILDSAVFLAAGGIAGVNVATAVIPEFPEIVVSNAESNDMNVTVYGVPDGTEAVMSTAGLPDDSSVTFTPLAPFGPNTPMFNMHTSIGPDTAAGSYPLTVAASVAGASVYAHVNVIVDCRPPFILSAPGYQPTNAQVRPGGTATLQVIAGGTGGFRYQWYVGHTGSTAFPIAGATSAIYTTPPITTATEFWARVSNACGSIDSYSAIVDPSVPASARQPNQRPF